MPQVACPHCSAKLKLKDSSLLGKPGKCPKCGHRFVLEERQPVASPSSVAEPSEAARPKKARVARRVKEGVAKDEAAPSTTAESPATKVAEPAATPTGSNGFPNLVTEGATSSGTSRMRELAKKRAYQRRRGMMMLGAIALCVGGFALAGYVFLPSEPARQATAEPEHPIENDVAYLSERKRLEEMATLIREERPASSEPITLNYVPAGASIIIHLHPAALYKSGSPGEEIRFCLGKTFDDWLTKCITTYCKLPPAKIEEATICLILGARGAAPGVAAVVRPVEPLKTSELIELFDGGVKQYHGVEVFVGSERAAVIGQKRDAQKRPLFFATASATDAEMLALSVRQPGITGEEIMQLLDETDRARDLTIVFRPRDLQIQKLTLFGEDLHPLVEAFGRFFGDEVEAAAWSLEFQNDAFVTDLALHGGSTSTPSETLKTFQGRLDKLSIELVDVVKTLNPRALGRRKLIGRLPAMVKALEISTVGGIDESVALLHAQLPERAAPNLALASLLTWDASLQAAAGPTETGPTKPVVHQSLAERLKKPIKIDFRDTPLELAFQYIGHETGVEFQVDGAGLKISGYTENMPQKFAMGTAPAQKAITHIITLEGQQDLAVVLDEKNNVAIVTTDAVVKKKGLTSAGYAAKAEAKAE